MRRILTLVEIENNILDIFIQNNVEISQAKTILWQLLTAIYHNELVQELYRREDIISNIEKQTDNLLVNILGGSK